MHLCRAQLDALDDVEGNLRLARNARNTLAKDMRKAISAMEMNFNSGVANVKKVLDELKDAPQLLAGRAPGLTSTVSTMEMKLKKDVMGLKRQLMEIGKKKDEL